MQTSFSCSHEGSCLFYSFCHAEVGVKADSSETHMSNHDWSIEFEVWSQFCLKFYVSALGLPELESGWFLSYVSPEFHRFSQGVNARVCNLTGVKEKAVIDNWQIPGVSHS